MVVGTDQQEEGKKRDIKKKEGVMRGGRRRRGSISKLKKEGYSYRGAPQASNSGGDGNSLPFSCPFFCFFPLPVLTSYLCVSGPPVLSGGAARSQWTLPSAFHPAPPPPSPPLVFHPFPSCFRTEPGSHLQPSAFVFYRSETTEEVKRVTRGRFSRI